MADTKAAQQTALELLEEDDEFEASGHTLRRALCVSLVAHSTRSIASQEFAEAAAQAHVEGAEETQLWQVRCGCAAFARVCRALRFVCVRERAATTKQPRGTDVSCNCCCGGGG